MPSETHPHTPQSPAEKQTRKSLGVLDFLPLASSTLAFHVLLKLWHDGERKKKSIDLTILSHRLVYALSEDQLLLESSAILFAKAMMV